MKFTLPTKSNKLGLQTGEMHKAEGKIEPGDRDLVSNVGLGHKCNECGVLSLVTSTELGTLHRCSRGPRLRGTRALCIRTGGTGRAAWRLGTVTGQVWQARCEVRWQSCVGMLLRH
ncbi:hypothetical protein DR999_PMT07329 [Platysternon megacephalum]|uniref:Uncharacterized protein n=1 Tax=Platysternon megacephalum TaxID=55544 RepID=A0A4D9EFU0_9SAUR|nr:hypothetical protein DR999_PMT07329 [Platysternon megacephalum]